MLGILEPDALKTKRLAESGDPPAVLRYQVKQKKVLQVNQSVDNRAKLIAKKRDQSLPGFPVSVTSLSMAAEAQAPAGIDLGGVALVFDKEQGGAALASHVAGMC